MLRYCRAAGVSVNWNLLYAMPGDDAAWYADSAALTPPLTHLHPPTGAFHLSIDRFGPYFDRAAQFDIANVRPMPAHLDYLLVDTRGLPDTQMFAILDADHARAALLLDSRPPVPT